MSGQHEPGLVLHVFGDGAGGLPHAIRSAGNARRDLGVGAPIELVVQGGAVRGLAADTGSGDGAEPLTLPDEEANVRVLACRNSLRSVDVEPADLRPGVGTVPAAVGHLARRQRDGWAYVRL